MQNSGFEIVAGLTLPLIANLCPFLSAAYYFDENDVIILPEEGTNDLATPPVHLLAILQEWHSQDNCDVQLCM